MNLKVLNLFHVQDQDDYKRLIAKVDGKNPYLTLDFLEIFSAGLKNAKCWYLETADAIVLLVGYIKKIDLEENVYDFTSPYGYSGPSYTGTKDVESSILQQFWKALDEWYVANHVISEFIRFSLNKNYIGYTGTLTPTISNVKGAIIDSETQWNNFERKVRKNVKRAQSENLKVKLCWGEEVGEDVLKEFHNIYISTMERTNANPEFYYTFDQFDSFRRKNPHFCAFAFVFDDEKIISTEMLLVSGDSIYSFLGGTLNEYFNKRPNDLLKYEVINWARANKISYFVLGGGYGKDDGIFNYKKSFFPNDIEPFFTGRKVIQQPYYMKLILKQNKRRKDKGLAILETSDTSFFPLYRKIN